MIDKIFNRRKEDPKVSTKKALLVISRNKAKAKRSMKDIDQNMREEIENGNESSAKAYANMWANFKETLNFFRRVESRLMEINSARERAEMFTLVNEVTKEVVEGGISSISSTENVSTEVQEVLETARAKEETFLEEIKMQDTDINEIAEAHYNSALAEMGVQVDRNGSIETEGSKTQKEKVKES